jgi:hypothetical protein
VQALAKERCFHHAGREAVARCPGCGRFFCRECVTEHEDRILCAGCLAREPGGGARAGSRLRPLAVALSAGLSLLFLWWCLWLGGRLLLAIPSSFHDGTLWKEIAEGS